MGKIEHRKYRVIENHVAKLTVIIGGGAITVMLIGYFLFVWL